MDGKRAHSDSNANNLQVQYIFMFGMKQSQNDKHQYKCVRFTVLLTVSFTLIFLFVVVDVTFTHPLRWAFGAEKWQIKWNCDKMLTIYKVKQTQDKNAQAHAVESSESLVGSQRIYSIYYIPCNGPKRRLLFKMQSNFTSVVCWRQPNKLFIPFAMCFHFFISLFVFQSVCICSTCFGLAQV